MRVSAAPRALPTGAWRRLDHAPALTLIASIMPGSYALPRSYW